MDKDLEKLIKITKQNISQPCTLGWANNCGCGLIHWIYYTCKKHHEQFQADANAMWQSTFKN